MPGRPFEIPAETFKDVLNNPASISRFDERVVSMGDVIAAHRRDLLETFGLKPIIGPLEVYPLVHELAADEVTKIFGNKIPFPKFDSMEAHETPLSSVARPFLDLITGKYRTDVIKARVDLAQRCQGLIIRNTFKGRPVILTGTTAPK